MFEINFSGVGKN